jgi:hypothetical protein
MLLKGLVSPNGFFHFDDQIFAFVQMGILIFPGCHRPLAALTVDDFKKMSRKTINSLLIGAAAKDVFRHNLHFHSEANVYLNFIHSL